MIYYTPKTGTRHILARGQNLQDMYPRMCCGEMPSTVKGRGLFMRACQKCIDIVAKHPEVAAVEERPLRVEAVSA